LSSGEQLEAARCRRSAATATRLKLPPKETLPARRESGSGKKPVVPSEGEYRSPAARAEGASSRVTASLLKDAITRDFRGHPTLA
jgi:hypothetical protein